MSLAINFLCFQILFHAVLLSPIPARMVRLVTEWDKHLTIRARARTDMRETTVKVCGTENLNLCDLIIFGNFYTKNI